MSSTETNIVVGIAMLMIGTLGFALGNDFGKMANEVTVNGEVINQCQTEESDGPCIWDAKTQGNKQGQSFYLDAEGRIFPIGQETP